MTDATIHLRVPATLKGRWVRLSRAQGVRLTDWIVNAVEAHVTKQLATIAIPDEIEFADLRLTRDPNGDVSVDMRVIERICESSGLPMEAITDAPEANLAGLIVAWYHHHRARGGATDPVAEDLIAETRAEDEAGQHASHRPGQA